MTKLTYKDKEKIFNLVVNDKISPKQVIQEYFPNITRQTISSVIKRIRQEQEEKITEIFTTEEEEEEEDEYESSSNYSSDYLPRYRKVKPKNEEQEQRFLSNQQPRQQEIQSIQYQKPIIQEPERVYVEKIVSKEIKPSPKRLELMTRIDAYIEKFSYKFNDIIGDNTILFKEKLKEYTDQELESLLETIRVKISSSGLRTGIHQIFYTATSVLENISIQNGLKLQGYADSLSKNESLRQALDEMSIEYMSFTCVSPSKRIMFIMLLSAVSLHNLNNQDEKLKEVLNQQIPQEKLNEYKDL